MLLNADGLSAVLLLVGIQPLKISLQQSAVSKGF